MDSDQEDLGTQSDGLSEIRSAKGHKAVFPVLTQTHIPVLPTLTQTNQHSLLIWNSRVDLLLGNDSQTVSLQTLSLYTLSNHTQTQS